MRHHLIFYDGDCPLCNKVVRFILKKDRKRVFLFASLQGKTAQPYLEGLRKCDPDLDTLVFLENYKSPREKILIRSKASFRILWHVGGFYRIPGALSFLPSFLFDSSYRLIARHRFKLFNGRIKKVTKDELQDRLLP